MSKELISVLLNKDFYFENKDLLEDGIFASTSKDLLKVLKWAFEDKLITSNINPVELKALYEQYYPTKSISEKQLVSVFIKELESVKPFSQEIAKVTLKQALINYYVDNAQFLLLEQHDSKQSKLDEIKQVLTCIERLENPQAKESNIISLDLQDLLDRTNKNCRWTFNIPALNEKVTGIGDGTLTLIAGRVNSGKTLACISFCFSPGGFASQGAKILYLCNEEDGAFTGIRAVSSYTGLELAEIEKDKIKASKTWAEIRKNVICLDQPRITIGQLEREVKKHKPDIVVVDQLDHVQMIGDYAREDIRLGQIYRQARELAKLYHCAFIGVSQTSAESDGKLHYGFDTLANSKTDKPAACDLILLIGADAPNDKGEYSDIRAINVAKNKITGRHGAAMAVQKATISRLVL